MSDWAQPSLTDSYSNFLDSLKARDYDSISLGVGTITTPQAGMMRYVRASNKFQEYDGTNWVDKVLSVAGGGTGSSTPAGAIGALGLGTMAVQNANNVNITGGSLSNLNTLHVTGTSSLTRVDVYAGVFVNAGGLAANGDSQFNNNLKVVGQVDCNVLVSANGIQSLSTLSVSGQCSLGSLVSMNYATINGAGGLTTEYDIWSKRDLTVSRNSNLVGNVTIGGLASIGTISSGNITGNIINSNRLESNVDGTIANDFSVGRNVSIGNQLNVGGGLFTLDMTASRNAAIVGTLYSGPGGQTTITNPADGRIIASCIGYNYTGAGTRVLMDDNQWHDLKTAAGGGVVEIVHIGVNFPEGVAVVTVNLPWAISQPAGIHKMHAYFDVNGLAQETYKFEYIGTSQINIRKLNPTLLTTNTYFSVIQYQ